MVNKTLLDLYLDDNFKPFDARVILKTCKRWDDGHIKDMLHVSSCGRILRIVESL